MISDNQKSAMALLAEVWALSPDVRLGQLFAHLGFLGADAFGKGLGDIDDDELCSILMRHRGELLARLQSNSVPESVVSAALGVANTQLQQATP
jgi:hypothetical protein